MAETNDQERIMTPKDAIMNGCDFLVVGRPITKNEDPANAAKLVAQEIEEEERIMTPKDAIMNGCDFLVVGRPITKNEDPANAAKLVAQEIEEGMKEAGLC